MSARSSATKRALYDAAVELIGQRGYEETSVDDIVDRAGMAKGTVYYHFNGKAELVDALIKDRTAPLLEEIARIEMECTTDPRGGVEHLVTMLLDFMTAEEGYTRLMLTELWRQDRPWYPTLVEARHEVVDSLCRLVRIGVARGVFRSDIDPDFAGYALFGMTAFVAMDRIQHEPARSLEDLRENLKRAVWASVKVCDD